MTDMAKVGAEPHFFLQVYATTAACNYQYVRFLCTGPSSMIGNTKYTRNRTFYPVYLVTRNAHVLNIRSSICIVYN